MRLKSPPPTAKRPKFKPVSDGGDKRGPGRPKLSSDAEQASAIVRQSRDLFMERGFGRTTMDDVVARCRISKTTLYRLFSNKTELYGAIIDAHRQTMLALPGQYDDLPFEEAIAKIFLVEIDEEANRERHALIHFTIREAQQFPELRDMLHERGGDRSHRELTKWLSSQKQKRNLHMPEPAVAAKALMDIMFGAAMEKPFGEADSRDRKTRIRHLRYCIDLFTRGVLPR